MNIEKNLDGEPDKYQSLPQVLRLYWAALCILTPLGFVATLFFTRVLHLYRYPYSSTLLPPEYNNGDFDCFRDRFLHFHQAAFFSPHGQPFNYPAPVAMVYEAFYGFSSHPTARFVEASAFCYLAAALVFANAMLRRRTRPETAILFSLTALLLSYPFLLEFYLSNMEVAVWVCLTLGLWAYAKNRSWAAAVCFGLAASLKIYPLIFLGLSLARRQYKQAALGLGVCAISMVGSLYVLGPTVIDAYVGLGRGVNEFKQNYIFHFNSLESGIDHSLFGLLKFVLGATRHLALLPRLAGPYLLVVVSVGVLLYFTKIRYLPAFNQVLALAVACVLLPPVSHDYTLIHLYAPWAMLVLFLLERRDEATMRGAALMLVAFAVLFSPENYLVLHGLRLGGPLKAVALMVLFFLALRYPIGSPDSRGLHANTT